MAEVGNVPASVRVRAFVLVLFGVPAAGIAFGASVVYLLRFRTLDDVEPRGDVASGVIYLVLSGLLLAVVASAARRTLRTGAKGAFATLAKISFITGIVGSVVGAVLMARLVDAHRRELVELDRMHCATALEAAADDPRVESCLPLARACRFEAAKEASFSMQFEAEKQCLRERVAKGTH